MQMCMLALFLLHYTLTTHYCSVEGTKKNTVFWHSRNRQLFSCICCLQAKNSGNEVFLVKKITTIQSLFFLARWFVLSILLMLVVLVKKISISFHVFFYNLAKSVCACMHCFCFSYCCRSLRWLFNRQVALVTAIC